MLAFNYRFHGYGSLRYVYRNGGAIRTHLMTLKFATNPKRSRPRAAVVVSKKVLKSSVGRNRIRRRIYEIIRQNQDFVGSTNDFVFIVSSSEVLNLPAAELEAHVHDLIKQSRQETV